MSEKRECERTGCVVGAISDRIGGLGGGGGIPGIAGPGTQSRSRSPAGSGLGAHGGRWGRDDHHRLGGDLEPGDGLVGRASYGPAAARSGREPVEPNSEERRRAAWQ